MEKNSSRQRIHGTRLPTTSHLRDGRVSGKVIHKRDGRVSGEVIHTRDDRVSGEVIHTRDDRVSGKDSRISPTSKRILEEITVKRRNVMRELANR